jgi:SAM-dependent methyltransferase
MSTLYEGLHEIDSCEVCGNAHLTSVLDLGAHPMCDDLVPIGDSRICREYPIEVLYCERCSTGHQRFQIPKQQLFPSNYHYRSRFTADVLSGMQGLVDSCGQRFGDLTGKTVLDIGCNDGSLLDCFRQRGMTTLGVEPTDACREAESKGHVAYREFLSEELADIIVAKYGSPDIITFTNVFAHIENLREVLASLRRLLTPKTVIVIENHYLGAVLDSNQFDTFYHEHPRSYSYTSFVHIAQALGIPLSNVEFPSRYGGNIRVYLGRAVREGYSSTVDLNKIKSSESQFLQSFATLRENIERWRNTKKNFLAEQVHRHGSLRAKAFPGRASILAKLLALDTSSVSAVYEKPGSLKIGNYVPGTRIPIASDEGLFSLPDQTRPMLNFAWHIPREIREYLTEHGYTGQVIDILSPQDFPSGH